MSENQIIITANAEQCVAGFDKVIQASRAVKSEINKLGKEGVDTAAQLEQIAKVGPAGLQAFARSAEAAAMPVDQLKAKLKELNKEAAQGAREAGEATASQAAAYQHQANMVGMVASQMRQWKSELVEAGKELASLNLSMGTTFGSKAAAPVVATIRELHLQTGIAESGLAHAAQTLNKFGQYSEENMKRAAQAAKVTGKDIESVAAAFSRFEKFGDKRSSQQIKRLLGLDPMEIAEANGLLDKHGKLLTDTAERRQKFIDATNKAMGDKFGRNLDDMSGAATKLNLEIHELEQDIGVNLINAQNRAAGAFIPLVQTMKAMPGWMKETAGASVYLGSTFASLGAQGLQLAANAKLAGLSFASFGQAGAMLGMLANPLGLVIAAVAAVAVGTALYIGHMEEENRVAEENVAEYEKYNKVLREHRDLRNDIAAGKPIHDAAGVDKTREALVGERNAIQTEIDRLKEEKKTWGSDNHATARIQKEIDSQNLLLAANIRQLAATRAAGEGAHAREAAETHAAKASMSTWEEYGKKVAASAYATKAAQLQALDQVIKGYGNATFADLRKKGVSIEAAQAVVEAEEKAKTARGKLVKEVADEATQNEVRALDKRKTLHEIGEADYAAGLARILARHKGSIAERNRLEQMYTQAVAAAVAERVKKEEDGIQRQIEDGKINLVKAAKMYHAIAQEAGLSADQRAAAQQKARQADKAATDEQVGHIERRAAAGKMTLSQEESALRGILRTHTMSQAAREALEDKLTAVVRKNAEQQQSIALQKLKQRVDDGKASLAELAALLEKQANNPNLSADQAEAKRTQAAGTRKEIADHEKSQVAAAAKAQEDLLKRQQTLLEQRMEKGENVTAQLEDLIHRQYATERAEIQKTAAEEDARYGKTEAGQKVLAARMADLSAKEADAVATVDQKRFEALSRALEKLNAIDAKQKQMAGFRGGGQSVSEAFANGGNMGFSLDTGGGDAASGTANGVSRSELEAVLNDPTVSPSDPRVRALYDRVTRGQKAAHASGPSLDLAGQGSNSGNWGAALPQGYSPATEAAKSAPSNGTAGKSVVQVIVDGKPVSVVTVQSADSAGGTAPGKASLASDQYFAK